MTTVLMLIVSLIAPATSPSSTDSDLRRIISGLQQQIADLKTQVGNLSAENDSLRSENSTLQKQLNGSKPAAVQDAIAKHQYAVGMSEADAEKNVQYWKSSVQREKTQDGSDVYETWRLYRTVLHFKNGVITSIDTF